MGLVIKLILLALLVYCAFFLLLHLLEGQYKTSSIPPEIEALQKRAYLIARDKRTVYRLVRQVRRNNPGKTSKWVWEKVVWDLERDRL